MPSNRCVNEYMQFPPKYTPKNKKILTFLYYMAILKLRKITHMKMKSMELSAL